MQIDILDTYNGHYGLGVEQKLLIFDLEIIDWCAEMSSYKRMELLDYIVCFLISLKQNS